jgi:O-antigen ligase
VLQADGTAGHQNLLGMTTHFAAFPLFALLLASSKGWAPRLGVLAGVAIQALTISRATIGLAAFGYTTVLALSAFRRWTTQTTLVVLIGMTAAGVLTPILFQSFERRFAIQGVTDYDERAAFRTAASMMIADHPFGVGANFYVVSANVEGYNMRAGVAPVLGSTSTNVHNVYFLVAAETGYLGLITFVLLILAPLIVAFRCGFRHRGDERGEMLIGMGVALLAVYVHSFFEWLPVTFQVQYLWALEAGMVAGLAHQLGYWGMREHARRPISQGVRMRIDGVPVFHRSAPRNPPPMGSNWRPPGRQLTAGGSARRWIAPDQPE